MELDYRTKGTCSSSIHVELDGRKIKRVVFTRRLQRQFAGISRLVEGMDIDEVIARTRGIRCGMKPTSRPGSAPARALEQAKEQLDQ